MHVGVLSTLGSSYEAFVRGRSLIEEVPRKCLGYTGAMFLFTILQETLRAARGKHDAINSGVAGALAGALVAGHYQGPQYRLLAASMWGPICLVSHVMNGIIKPRPLIEDWLISEGLLDPVVRERRAVKPTMASDSQQQGMPMETLIDMATRIRDRELQTLYDASRNQTTPALAAINNKRNIVEKAKVDEKEEVDHEYESWLIEATKAGVAISLDPSPDEDKDKEEASSQQATHRSWIDWIKGKPKPQ